MTKDNSTFSLQASFIWEKYLNFCKRKGLCPHKNECFFTVNNRGYFIIGIMKPFKQST